jgi:glycosyltransferase involved in cell wall biosynthesis
MEPDRRVPGIINFALNRNNSSMNEITFSVVVPTHNRSELLATLFDTLAIAKAEFSGQMETIIIDSSSGAEAHAIQSLCEKHSARYLRCTNQVTRKRNLGVQEATGEYIFFTDSDCELSKDVFVQHALTYESSGEHTGGVLGLTQLCGDTAPIWSTLHLDSSFTTSFSFARWMETAP